MSTTYSVWLTSPTGQRLKNLDRFTRLSYTLATNQVSPAQVDVLPDFNMNLVQEDSRLEIYRHVQGGARYLEGDQTWLIRDWVEAIDAQGREVITLLAYSGIELLDRPIVAYKATTSQADKTGTEIDDMMKAYVRENMGSLATDSARNLSDWLSVQADTAAGPESDKAASFRQLLSVLRELAQDSHDQGNPIFFDVVKSGRGFRFETYQRQRGDDHTGSGSRRVVLSPQTGTVAEVSRTYATLGERNIIKVGGQGQDTTRNLVTVTDSARVAVSPLNRREYFVNASNTPLSGLAAEGQAALKSFRLKETYQARIRQGKSIRYGREYKWGDRVLMQFKVRTVEARLDTVEVTLERGLETINGELRLEQWT